MLAQLLQIARGEPRGQKDLIVSRNKNFKELGGFIYDGLGGVSKESEWSVTCKHLFDLMYMESIPKRELVAHNLTSTVMLWWRAHETTLTLVLYTWEQFEASFHPKFILSAKVGKLINEFNVLKQDGMRVGEYAIKFDDLSWYVLHMIIELDTKKSMFVNGINFHM